MSSSFNASEGQKALYFFSQAYPNSPAYNVGYLWKVNGVVEENSLIASLQKVADNHPLLRTTYQLEDNQLVGKTHLHGKVPLKVVDADSWTHEELQDYYLRQLNRPFDLKTEFSWNWFAIKELGVITHLIVVWHHIGVDLCGQVVVIDELKRIYQGLEPDPATLDFSVQVSEEVEWLQGKQAKRQLGHWGEQLKDVEPLNFPLEQSRPLVKEFHRSLVTAKVPEQLAQRLNALATLEKTSLFTLFMGTYQVFLSQTCAQDCFMVGAPVSTRKSARFGRTMGYFINTLGYEASVRPDQRFTELLAGLRSQARSALRNKDYPYPLLVREFGQGTDRTRPAFFQTALGWEEPNMYLKNKDPLVKQSPGRPEYWDMGDWWLQLEDKRQVTEFELLLRVTNNQGVLTLFFEYDTQLFTQPQMKQWMDSLLVLLSSIADDPSLEVSQLNLLSEKQTDKLLNQWACRHQTPIGSYDLAGMVTQWSYSRPESLALYTEQESLTYAELEERSNRLAHWLLDQGCQPEELIGLASSPNSQMLVGLLGIHKAGAAYLPLDPNYPVDRLQFMLDDGGVTRVLADAVDRLPTLKNVRVIEIHQIEQQAESLDLLAPLAQRNLDSLSYVIYTSGSTGQPKGVLIEHRGLSNFILHLVRCYKIKPSDRCLQFGSFNFDISILEIAMTLGGGATLVMAPKEELLPGPGLVRFLDRTQVSVMCLTPTALATLPEAKLPHLRAIVSGGEACSPTLVGQWGAGRHFFNAYGPTEGTIAVATGEVKPGMDPVPLGFPLGNVSWFLLDKFQRLVLPGSPGELYVGGPGLARGYLNREELTEEKFVNIDVGDGRTRRLYRTGDLVRYTHEGQLLYLGRLDQQIKYKGYRIEPGEIEAALCQLVGIKQARVAVVKDHQHPVLVGYVVGEGEPHAVQDQLKEHLPAHLIPAAIVFLESFPLTPNGKLDLNKLPAPPRQIPEKEFVQDQNSVIAQQVVQLWTDTLGHREFSTKSAFFEVGGDSLGLATLHQKLEETLGTQLQITDLFQHPTLGGMIRFFEGKNPKGPVGKAFDPVQRIDGPVAIIGMACQFAQAENIDQFWSFLAEGAEGIKQFKPDELKALEGYQDTWGKPPFVPSKGWLETRWHFDPEYFGYSPAEAALLDPQHRLFLESAVLALEDAGCDPERFQGRIGVYGGSGNSGYLTDHLLPTPGLVEQVGKMRLVINNDKDFLCNRVSHKLGLTGPAVVVQSGCSTSLVAIHTACQALQNGETEVALAGGVSLVDLDQPGYFYEPGSIASPDGHNRTFDVKANGTVPSQGVGMVVLKTLREAEKDGDHIYGLIESTAINNDGADKIGFTAPSVSGQAAVLQSCLDRAGLSPNQIDYIETHGTATPLGDPIEIAALAQVYGKRSGEQPKLKLGSLKSNFGHLDAAAGVAGVIKGALMCRKSSLVGSLHFNEPNPELNLDQWPFEVITDSVKWERGSGPRRIGVSSFGIGGTNAHLILKEYKNRKTSLPNRLPNLFMLSSKTSEGLKQLALQLETQIKQEKEPNLRNWSYSLAEGRPARKSRYAFVASAKTEVLDQLSLCSQRGGSNGAGPQKTGFLFPGQGTQYINMGKQLFSTQPKFHQQMTKAREVFGDITGHDLFHNLYPDRSRSAEASKLLGQSWLTQPAVYSVEFSLAQLWMDMGVEPKALCGHSVGEYAAAALAGVFTFEEGLYLTTHRGRLTEEIPPGDMMHLRLGLTEARAFILPFPGIGLAAHNGLKSVVVSGPSDAVHRLSLEATKQQIPFKRLFTSHAFHSAMLDPMAVPYGECLKTIDFKAPTIPLISNVTGDWASTDQLCSVDYWLAHLRQPVEFYQGLSTFLEESDMAVIEAGPGSTLSGLLQGHPHFTQETLLMQSLPSAKAGEEDAYLLSQMSKYWQSGCHLNIANQFDGATKVSLKSAPFLKKPYKVCRVKAKADVDPLEKLSLFSLGFEPVKDEESKMPEIRFLVGFTTAEQEIIAARSNQVVALSPVGIEWTDQWELVEQLGVDHPEVEVVFEVKGIGLELFLDSVRSLAQLQKPLTIKVILSSTLSLDQSEKVDESLITGFMNGLNLEFPQVTCQTLYALGVSSTELTTQLNQPSKDRQLRFEQGQWMREKAEPCEQEGSGFKLLKSGVYLVTGASGGIGSALVEYLVDSLQAKVICLGQSEDKLKTSLSNINPEQILCLPVDLESVDQVIQAFEQGTSQFGPISGGFHLAGTAPWGTVKEKSFGQIQETLSPKVRGTLNLDVGCQQFDVPWMVAFSSISSLIGGYGLLDYCAANRFLDEFAQGNHSTHWVSINWDTWRETGMAVQPVTQGKSELLELRLQRGMTNAEGFGVLDEVLGSGASQVIVTKQPLEAHQQEAIRFAQKLAPRTVLADDLPGDLLNQGTIQMLKDRFQACLGGTTVGLEDNFFGLGGDSLMAITLINDINRLIDPPLPTTALMASPTVKDLAVAIEGQQKKPKAEKTVEYQFLVPISKPNSHRPVFVFPTGGGYVYYYKDFAQTVESELNTVGFQARGLDGKEPPFGSIEEMARAFTAELIDFYPQGTVVLGGASFGGLVAFEVSQQLIEKGREVELLFLIDTPGPGQMPIRFDDNVMIIKELVGEYLKIDEQALAKMSPEEQVDYISELARQANIADLLPPDFGVPFLKVVASHMKAMFSYEPKAYQGHKSLLYFRHTERLPEYPDHPELPWTNLSGGEIDIRKVKGNHYTMNFAPNVNKIGAEVRRRLRETDY